MLPRPLIQTESDRKKEARIQSTKPSRKHHPSDHSWLCPFPCQASCTEEKKRTRKERKGRVTIMVHGISKQEEREDVEKKTHRISTPNST